MSDFARLEAETVSAEAAALQSFRKFREDTQVGAKIKIHEQCGYQENCIPGTYLFIKRICT